MASSLLILGGARSGKSRYALAGLPARGRVSFVATAEPLDGDMAARIARHRAERPRHWTTVEAPRDLVPALTAALHAADTVVVDCLTLWVSNLMLAGADDATILGGADALAALSRNGLRYPVPPYGIQSDAAAGLAVSYADKEQKR